jgi:hypothetical protein
MNEGLSWYPVLFRQVTGINLDQHAVDAFARRDADAAARRERATRPGASLARFDGRKKTDTRKKADNARGTGEFDHVKRRPAPAKPPRSRSEGAQAVEDRNDTTSSDEVEFTGSLAVEMLGSTRRTTPEPWDDGHVGCDPIGDDLRALRGSVVRFTNPTMDSCHLIACVVAILSAVRVAEAIRVALGWKANATVLKALRAFLTGRTVKHDPSPLVRSCQDSGEFPPWNGQMGEQVPYFPGRRDAEITAEYLVKAMTHGEMPGGQIERLIVGRFVGVGETSGEVLSTVSRSTWFVRGSEIDRGARDQICPEWLNWPLPRSVSSGGEIESLVWEMVRAPASLLIRVGIQSTERVHVPVEFEVPGGRYHIAAWVENTPSADSALSGAH